MGWGQVAAQGNSYPSLVLLYGVLFPPPFSSLQPAAAVGGSFSAGDGGHGEHSFIDRNTKWSMNVSG